MHIWCGLVGKIPEKLHKLGKPPVDVWCFGETQELIFQLFAVMVGDVEEFTNLGIQRFCHTHVQSRDAEDRAVDAELDGLVGAFRRMQMPYAGKIAHRAGKPLDASAASSIQRIAYGQPFQYHAPIWFAFIRPFEMALCLVVYDLGPLT